MLPNNSSLFFYLHFSLFQYNNYICLTFSIKNLSISSKPFKAFVVNSHYFHCTFYLQDTRVIKIKIYTQRVWFTQTYELVFVNIETFSHFFLILLFLLLLMPNKSLLRHMEQYTYTTCQKRRNFYDHTLKSKIDPQIYYKISRKIQINYKKCKEGLPNQYHHYVTNHTSYFY